MVAERTESFIARMEDGAGIALRRWGVPRRERFVISHGNGLAIDAFAAFGATLAQDYEVIAFDMRNHGWNETHRAEGNNWNRFLEDFPQIMAAIEDRFGVKPTHGAFHSLSSATCLMSAAQTAYPWRSLTLYEPPVTPSPEMDLHLPMLRFHDDLSRRAAARRSVFGRPEELAQSMRRARAFAFVPPETIDLLARATLRRNRSQWCLTCPPDFEAATFDVSMNAARWPAFADVDVPVRLVLGDRKISPAPILIDVGDLLAERFGFQTRTVSGGTHFMQLEQPERCAALAKEFARLHISADTA